MKHPDCKPRQEEHDGGHGALTPSLRPFWRYYGGKWRAAPRYPQPLHDTIVEPFAGAAGYATRYPDRHVVLVEKYAVVAEMWRYLIAVTPAEVRCIPLTEDVRELPMWVPEGARALVGFAMNNATTSPRTILSSGKKKLAAMGRRFEGWCENERERVASQVARIKHWKIVEGDYSLAPEIEATWFVDPPYQRAGKEYIHAGDKIDFIALGGWCRSRRGQVMVCENDGADWLPFEPFMLAKAGPARRVSAEALWMSGSRRQP